MLAAAGLAGRRCSHHVLCMRFRGMWKSFVTKLKVSVFSVIPAGGWLTSFYSTLAARVSHVRAARLIFVGDCDREQTPVHPKAEASRAVRAAAQARVSPAVFPDLALFSCQSRPAPDTISAFRMKQTTGQTSTRVSVSFPIPGALT